MQSCEAIALADLTRLTRGVLSVLLLTLVAVTCRPAGADGQAYPDKPVVPAQSARAFGDSVGVNVRMHLTNSAAYGDFPTLTARLRDLGVRNIGDGLCPTCEAQIQRLAALGVLGIKATIGVGNQTDTLLREQRLQVIRSRLLGSVVAIVGPNEPDISGDAQWIANTRSYQAALYNRVKSDPALAHMPVIGPSLVYRESRAALGNLSGYIDRGNIHPYPAGVPPMTGLALEYQLASQVSGSKPLIATETGYHDDITYTGIHRGASERAAGYYTPRSVLEAFRAGIERTFLFQLADAWSPSQAQQWGLEDRGNSFGLLRWNLAPKPAFTALRNLMHAVDSGSAPVTAPGGLRFGLEGAGPDVRQMLLRSADGSFALVLWRNVSVWDRDALNDLYPGADPLEVVLGERIALARRFEPVEGDGELQRWTEPRRIPVALGGGPVVLRLTPPGLDGTAPTDKAKTRKLVRSRKRQRLRRFVVVKVACTARCDRVTAKGKLVVKGKRARRPKRFNLKPAKDAASKGAATLRLRISPRSRRAAAKALKRGGTVRATITVSGRTTKGVRLWTAKKRIVLTLR